MQEWMSNFGLLSRSFLEVIFEYLVSSSEPWRTFARKLIIWEFLSVCFCSFLFVFSVWNIQHRRSSGCAFGSINRSTKEHRWLQISSCAGKCLFISQSLCKWFLKRDLLNPPCGCSHGRLEIPIFLLTAFSIGEKKIIGETPNPSICCLYLFGFYSTPKKCASGIPITSGKSLKKQEIKAEQIKSCSHLPLHEEAALKKFPVLFWVVLYPGIASSWFHSAPKHSFLGEGFKLHKVQRELY